MHPPKAVSNTGNLRTSRFLIPTVLLLTVGVVVAQFAIPFGWALGGLYIIPVSLAAFWTSYRQTFVVVWVATLSTILNTMVFFGSPFWDNKATLAMAYVLPVGSMWLISLQSILRKWQERKVKTRSKHQLLCPHCQRIHSEEKSFSIKQYAVERPDSFVRLRTCSLCVEKEG